jgi:hypothetical protein
MRLIPIIIFLLIPFLVKSQTVCTSESKERLDAYLLKLSEMDLSEKSPNERIIEIGNGFSIRLMWRKLWNCLGKKNW